MDTRYKQELMRRLDHTARLEREGYKPIQAKKPKDTGYLLALLILCTLIGTLSSTTVYAKPEVHDNQYYCNEWKAGELVIGGTPKEIEEACK